MLCLFGKSREVKPLVNRWNLVIIYLKSDIAVIVLYHGCCEHYVYFVPGGGDGGYLLHMPSSYSLPASGTDITFSLLKIYSESRFRDGILCPESRSLPSVSQSINGSTPTSLSVLGSGGRSFCEAKVTGRERGISTLRLNTFSGEVGPRIGVATFAGKRLKC